MRHFLWIAHFYPPVNSITGLRTAKLAACLPEFGWEPIIVTRCWDGESGQEEPPGLHVIRTGYRDCLGLFRHGRGSVTRDAVTNGCGGAPARQAFSMKSLRLRLRLTVSRCIKEVMACPDEFIGWRPFAIEAGRDVIAREKPALILSTSYPFTSHLVGSQLQRECGLPWIAEFQDPWTQGPAWHYTGLRLRYETRLELRTIAPAAALTIVTPPWVEGLRVMHGKPVALIENGFDQTEYDSDRPPLTPQFTITYTGMIYSGALQQDGYAGRRDPSPLFAAVKDLLDDGTLDPAHFAIRFYGPPNEQPVILALAERHGIHAVVTHYGQISHEEAVQRQRESTLLLLLNWHGAKLTYKEQGWYTAKVYEYLAARRPILAVPGHPGVDGLLAETCGGISANTREELGALLRHWYREFQATGMVADHGIPEAIEAHTDRTQAQHFARLMDEVLAVQAGQKAYIAPEVAR